MWPRSIFSCKHTFSFSPGGGGGAGPSRRRRVMSTAATRDSEAPRAVIRPLLDAGDLLDAPNIDPVDSDTDEFTSIADLDPHGDEKDDQLFESECHTEGTEVICRASVYETPPITFQESSEENIFFERPTSNEVDEELSLCLPLAHSSGNSDNYCLDTELSHRLSRTEACSPLSEYYSIEYDNESSLDRTSSIRQFDKNSAYLEDVLEQYSHLNDIENSNQDQLFTNQENINEEFRDNLHPLNKYSESPPPLNDAAMSYQGGSEPCHVTSEDNGDNSINHRRLLELVNALAENLGQPPDAGVISDQDDIRSGCQINLAFEDTEPDLQFHSRYLDITQSDFDHLPWYFQDSEDDLSNLIYPDNDLSSKRPHSIAVPSEAVQNTDLVRSHPNRSTVCASNRGYHIPDRPVSAVEITGGHEIIIPETNEAFVRSNPARSTTGMTSKYKVSFTKKGNILSENGVISESPELCRSNPTRSTICVPHIHRNSSRMQSGVQQERSNNDLSMEALSDASDNQQQVFGSNLSNDVEIDVSPVVINASSVTESRQQHQRQRRASSRSTESTVGRTGRRSSSLGNPRRVSLDADHVTADNRMSAASSDEIDWSWVAGEAQRLEATEMNEVHAGVEDSQPSRAINDERPSSWLRASMRRVQHFHLGEPPRVRSAPPESVPPLPPLGAQVLPALETTGAGIISSPTNGARDFPRRYSATPTRRLEIATASSSNSSLVGESRRQRRRSSPARRRSSSCSSHRIRRDSSRPSSSSESSDDVPASAATTNVAESPSSTTQQDSSSMETDSPSARPCDGRSSMADNAQSPLGHWPHNLSSMLACLGCTLGLFNISRFAIYCVQFGANFILQFLFISLVLGIPLYTFHASIGQFLAAGVMDMWRISPIFQGIGIALLVSHALIGIYSIVGVSWMFIYFRDSFITRQDRYRWAEPYHDDVIPSDNASSKLEYTVPDYLNGVVLQRHSLQAENSFGHLKFQVTFNLAVVWMIVFVSLSKGLKSYGKVVYCFSLFPVFGMLILCIKLLGLTPINGTHHVFPETAWSEFFLNTRCWVVATTEAFFTWGLLGAAIMQIASHNRHKHLLHRDVSLVIILTLAILLLAAFLANTCVQLLAGSGYNYVPSSFEHMRVYTFLSEAASTPPVYAKNPVRLMPHSTFIAGSRIMLPTADTNEESGYQVLRLATELVPSTFALLGAENVSPFWAVLFYFVLILFGIAQQLAIWHCVITGIMAINATSLKSWETTITFFSCACGFILGLPMTTELGIYVVYFLDYTVGCGWWLMVLYLVEIGAVFVVRGRPYSGESVVSTLFNKGSGCLQVWAAPMLVFTWNVILPVALMVICITVFKNGKFRELYTWNIVGNHYWPLWAREVGCLLQLLPIITIPLVGFVQSCRYLSNGPPDLFDRIQLLYRPPAESEGPREHTRPANTTTTQASTTTNNGNVSGTTVTETPFEDPPPKYTPPPSYTTATGARIAKLLRQSFRRSMRRITSVLGDNAEPVESTSPRVRAPLPPPPDYAAVLVEINQALENRDQRTSESGCSVAISVTDVDSARTSANNTGHTMNITRPTTDTRISTLTAADVAHILRSSLRRTLRHGTVRGEGNEQLMQGAAPINHDALGSQAKTDQDNTTSVI